MIVIRSHLAAAWLSVAGVLLQSGGTAAQTAPSPEVQKRIDNVRACLITRVVEKDDPHDCQSLQDRMAAERIPGVSIAVIHNGVIEWAQGFGVAQIGGSPVTPETLFQAGSISKPVAALAALRLVEERRLALDTDVNQTMTSWKIPASAVMPDAVVTLRDLLNHTAGLRVHGFPGYAAGEPVPTLTQVLDGARPANSAPIRLEARPKSRWQYSGGGYTVMQQLLIDASGQPFPKLMQETVLAPLGMTRSTYDQPPPAELHSSLATPYKADGAPVAGGFHVYPEMAAAGLWTTPTDLAKYVIEVQRAFRGEADRVLTAEMTRQMLVAGQGNYGLGLVIGGARDNPYFAHGGVNAGFEAMLVAYRQSGNGAVIMTNAQGGQLVANEILRSIARVYEWPDFQPTVRKSITVDPDVLSNYTGVYEITPAFSLTITLENGQLMSQVRGQRKIPLFAESQSQFFMKIMDAQVTFARTDAGQISHLVLRQNGRDFWGNRKQ